jgi:hypothetical protein
MEVPADRARRGDGSFVLPDRIIDYLMKKGRRVHMDDE